jgi:hypothetical protein
MAGYSLISAADIVDLTQDPADACQLRDDLRKQRQ